MIEVTLDAFSGQLNDGGSTVADLGWQDLKHADRVALVEHIGREIRLRELQRIQKGKRRRELGVHHRTGTSLAGALRAACRRRYGPDAADRLFGPAMIGEDGAAYRSPVRVHDARPASTAIPPVQLRQHVGIDRERLAAYPG